ncbi:MAG: amidohydrolase [Rhodothermales bacterium]
MRIILLLAVLLAGCANPYADTIYTNAVVWTGNPDQPVAGAIATRGHDIIYVGDTLAVQGLLGERTRVVDLEGRFVVPGFIDNHTHFLSGGFNLASVQLRDVTNPEEFARRMGAFAATLEPGEWILGGDWDHEAWGGQLPERAWIDSVTADNPVLVSRLDGHMALANSRALELAGVSEETPVPDGGEIVVGADGRLTGVLKDDAMDLVFREVPAPTLEQRLEMLERAQDYALSLGVTQIHDVGSYGGWADREAFREAHKRDLLKLRVYSLVPVSTWERLEPGGDEYVWWGGLKGFVDGSLGSTTALFYEPYLDDPSTSGLLVNDTTLLRQHILAADAAGLHLAIHAIGDKANDWLLDVYAQAAARTEREDRRWRIEHAQHLTPEAIERFAALGVVPSMQPYHAIDDGRWAEKRIGDRIETTYPFRSLLDADAMLTFGSDWTVAPLNPLLGVYAAVTRRTIDDANPGGWVPAQKITVQEALESYTVRNAWAGFSDAFSGAIEPGLRADFVVLSRNLLEIDPETIPDVRVMRTVIDGEEVFIRE